MTLTETLMPEKIQEQVKEKVQSVKETATKQDWMNVGAAERLISLAGGVALTVAGIRKLDSKEGVLMTLAGGLLAVRGATGFCPVNMALGIDSNVDSAPVEIRRSVTINKPRPEVYSFWRKLENLPQFMMHLETVVDLGNKKSKWTARAPKGLAHIEWEAEITEEKANQLIAWQSVENADIENSGEVSFKDAPGNRGTEVTAVIKYNTPGGAFGRAAAKLLNPSFKQMVKEDIRNFKHLMETGELPVLKGQPSARKEDK